MKRLGKWLLYTILMLILAIVIFAILLPAVFESRLAVVLSSSMEPALPKGSLVVMSSTNPSRVEVGDIIAFHPPWGDSSAIVSHRVVEVLPNGFGTKGDANESVDPYVIPTENLVASVEWHIANVGTILEDLREMATNVWGFTILIILPTIIIVYGAIQDTNMMINSSNRRARLKKRRAKLLNKRLPASRRPRRAF